MKKLLNPKELLFLELLVEHKSLCGVEIVELSEGNLTRGVAFAIASNFEAMMLVSSYLEEKPLKRIPRRFFVITESGRIILNAVKKVSRINESRELLDNLVPV